MTFFTSDQHFGHFNIIRLCSRPFGTVEEMDEALLSKWNAKVKADDIVYILGDLFFRAAKVEPILKALNGRKHLIVGNHDHTWMKGVATSDYFASVQTLKEVEIDGMVLTLCHYPMLSYPQARRGYMVYGHIHNNVRDDYWPLIARRSLMPANGDIIIALVDGEFTVKTYRTGMKAAAASVSPRPSPPPFFST